MSLNRDWTVVLLFRQKTTLNNFSNEINKPYTTCFSSKFPKMDVCGLFEQLLYGIGFFCWLG